ncbi:MAG: rod shape-determining protein MreD [Azospirillum sp.]|nr:rod shape-determining protein MreD [Azospirillum sp.]
MTVSVWQRVDLAGRSLAPAAVTVMLVLVSMVPLPIPGLDRVSPALALMSVYYWAIHRPDLLRPSVAFAIGLLNDLLSGDPLGLSALVLVLVLLVVISQRGFFLANSFLLLWWGFTLIVLGAAVVRWTVISLLLGDVVPADAPLFQALLTLALFPVVAWLLIRVHRAFLVQA